MRKKITLQEERSPQKPEREKVSRLYNAISFMLLLVVFVAGCKKVTEEAGSIGICPIVISTDPANGAVNVATNKKITATFNVVMDPSTVNATTFLLKQGTSPVAGTVSYAGTTATFTPANALSANTVYTGTITTGSKDLAGSAPLANFVWSFNTGNVPTVISTDPINGASGVALNKIITATFSTTMDASTINATTFLLKQGASPVAGTISYAGSTGTFTPAIPLLANTVYTGIITTGAKDASGNAMVSNYSWSFSTSTVPTVISTDPNNGATSVPLNKTITASFSTLMDPLTINATTVLLKQGATSITGTVSYSGVTATFIPASPLAANTIYTGTITTGVKNVSGNALANNYVWSFTTTGSSTPPPILGSAANFGAFGGNAGITNQGLNTIINNGGIGTTAASTLITGFHDGITADIYTETPLNKGNVTGGIYTAPPAAGTDISFKIATAALADATIAYNSISPASKPGGIDPGAGELGGLTLAPGIYKSASGTFKITNGNLTLDAMGDPNATWVFQTAAGLTVGIAGPSGARSVVMINGGLPKNVYWYVGSAAVINAAGGGIMSGTIISSAGVTFSTAGNAVQTVLNGRAISLVASVTMVNTTINVQ